MPTSKIKKDAREGKGTVKSLEHKWDESKDAAGKKGGKQNWPLTMYIYKKKTHQAHVAPPKRKLKKGSPFTRLAKSTLGAVARLSATVKAGDVKWVIAKKSGPSSTAFPREVKVTRLLRPLDDQFDCEIEDLKEGHRTYFFTGDLYDSEAAARVAINEGARPKTVTLGQLQAAQRLATVDAIASMEVNCDAFEGWINTLGYDYERMDGKEIATVDAPLRQLVTDLKENGWTKIKEPPTHPYTFRKGAHIVALEPEGGRTTITNMD